MTKRKSLVERIILSSAILLGGFFFQVRNHARIEEVYGNKVIITDFFPGYSFTPGPFIVMGKNKDFGLNDEVDDLYKHESGHVEQFKKLGIFYYPIVAFPSIFNCYFLEDRKFYTEMWANELAEEKYGPFADKKQYPIAKK
ncbi:hypothetical protein HYX16_06050 [Candidatus Woesearchaeota archaeon]|nr:hypothetical protein [Candidatus Woesearchaeota archaeon]